jgi:hypothetical protein
MTNMYRVLCYFNKISDFFPVFGGSAGAVSQSSLIHYFPTWEAIIAAVIISVIGALFGYIVKMWLDWLLFGRRRKTAKK